MVNLKHLGKLEEYAENPDFWLIRRDMKQNNERGYGGAPIPPDDPNHQHVDPRKWHWMRQWRRENPNEPSHRWVTLKEYAHDRGRIDRMFRPFRKYKILSEVHAVTGRRWDNKEPHQHLEPTTFEQGQHWIGFDEELKIAKAREDKILGRIDKWRDYTKVTRPTALYMQEAAIKRHSRPPDFESDGAPGGKYYLESQRDMEKMQNMLARTSRGTEGGVRKSKKSKKRKSKKSKKRKSKKSRKSKKH